ncbi:MAG: efflux RND transporter permease subunit [Nitrospirae bacterium]|nr:efflux RND transporter permease subunit [Nitrospirota bacterium]
MWIADTAIRRPVFATMAVMALVVLGIVSYPSIGVELFPKVDFPIVSVTTTLRGASPEVIDVDVTDKIEESLNTINGVKYIASTSMEGVSSVIVEFVLEKNIDIGVADIREKISLIRSKLPVDVEEPVIEKVATDSMPILWLSLTGDRPVRDISTYADEVVKEQLQRINGVGAISLAGMRLRQIRIWLDRDKLLAYQISASDVVQALKRGNVELPGGRVESGTKEYSVKIKGQFRTPEEFNDLVISYSSGAPVRLRDVGKAEDDMEDKRSISRFNGKTSVGLGIQKQTGANTVEVVDNVKNALTEIKKTLPPGITLQTSFDQSDFIKKSITEVQHHLVYGGIFACIAVFIFLHSLRITLISALAIPTSVVSTFVIMHAFDFTFNNMTMLALSLSIGILVDDAIIVIENIYRHVQLGMKPKEAASFATEEIGVSVIATTLAIVAIFLPVAFMKGIVGRFFLQFALTVVFAVMMSMFVSLTLTPMLASRFLSVSKGGGSPIFRKPLEAFERLYKRTEGYYKVLLGYTIDHRIKVLVIAAAVFAFSLYITKFIGKEMVPPEDQGRFVVRLQAPVDYSVDAVDSMFKHAADIVAETPEAKSIFYAQGYGVSGAINKGSLFVELKPKGERNKSQGDIKIVVRKRLSTEIPGLKSSVEDVSMFASAIRNVPVQYAIRGNNLDELLNYTDIIANKYSKLPGIVDVDTSYESGKPEVAVYIDRTKAADMGVDITTIAEAINILIGGEMDVTKFKDEAKGRRYDVRVRLNPQDRASPSDIERIYVRNKDGKLIELANLIQIRESGAPTLINRIDRQRAVFLFANLEDKPLGQAKEELEEMSKEILPPGFTGVFKGMAESMGETFYYLIIALVLGVVLAYMILASQFESFIHPITVLLSMPLSFIGAFGALLITHNTLNIFSFIGLVLLMGLVKKNAILLVSYIITLREGGMDKREAILTAGPVRLRPILMTTVAMVFGMMPIALGLGEGSETRAPMAIATIGGLITSLFLTLLVIPAAYDLFDEIKSRFTMKKAAENR